MSDQITKVELCEAEIIDPMQIIKSVALNNDIPVDKLTALFDLETRIQERESKKEFTRAIAKFQHECPIIEKADKGQNSSYAKLDRIWSTIQPLMKECGLALIWSSERIDDAKRFCVLDGELVHTSGYSKPVHSEMAIPSAITRKSDGKAIQNEAQIIGSAITYCKRYATCGVMGIQTGVDDDANGWEADTISEEQVEYLKSHIAQAGDQMPEKRIKKMLEFAGCALVEKIPTTKYKDVKNVVDSACKDKEAAEELPS